MKNQTKSRQALLPEIISMISIAFLIILWEASTSLRWVNPIFLPAPQSVFSTFMELLRDGYKGASLTTHISVSLYRLFVSLVIACLTAVPLGIMCGYSKYVLAIFDPIIEFYRPLPPTSLLNVIASFQVPDSGKVNIDGISHAKPGPDVGVVFQQPNLFPWLSIENNLAFGLKMKKMDKKERKQFIAHYLQLTGLEAAAKKLPYQLSGGMKQRAAIARTLAANPKVILMDEPFSALDA